MRKLIVTVAMAAFALGAAAACTSETPTTTATTPATSTTTAATGGDATAAVCAEAQAYNATAFTAIAAKWAELEAAIKAQDTDALTKASDEGTKLLEDWEAKLAELIAKQPKAEVVTALTNMKALASGDNDATADELQGEFTKLAGAIATACA